MAELTQEQFLEKLDADQKAFFQTAVTKAGETAVTTFKENRKKEIPEKYELKFADGTVLDKDADASEVSKFAKENGLTNVQAQALLDHNERLAKGVKERRAKTSQTKRDEWRAQANADKDLGGEKLPETLKVVKLAMDAFAPEGSELRKFFSDTKYGNHIEVIRFLHKLGKKLQEDKGFGGGGGGGGGNKTWAEKLYSNASK